MKTITLASRKGGAGKTTLAAHLAVLALDRGSVLLLDADPQGSLRWWWDQREGDAPQLAEVKAGALAETVKAAEGEGFATVVVDCAPHAEAGIAEAMRVADLVIVPCRPGPLDLAAVPATLAMSTALRKPALAVLNAAPPPQGVGEPTIVREARLALEGAGVKVAETAIATRAALSHALISGEAVTEFDASGKAAREMQSLWREIASELGE
ncbi:MAG: AAA family ATPase [Pseudomonadota bacterium]